MLEFEDQQQHDDVDGIVREYGLIIFIDRRAPAVNRTVVLTEEPEIASMRATSYASGHASGFDLAGGAGFGADVDRTASHFDRADCVTEKTVLGRMRQTEEHP